MNTIGIDWSVKASGWTKHLGYGLGLSSCGCFCSIDCLPVIEALYQRHMGAHNTYKPKHPYPMNINELKPGVRTPIDSPERAPFDEMQAKCQNGLATSIWISRAHTLHVYPTNYLCGMMSNPSYEVYKAWQHSLMAERASPCPLGSGRKVSLAISADPPRPFSGVRQREMGLHMFFDADLGHRRRVLLMQASWCHLSHQVVTLWLQQPTPNLSQAYACTWEASSLSTHPYVNT